MCTVCKRQHPLTSFTKLTKSEDGYYTRCKECSKAYRDDPINKERNKKYMREYMRENPTLYNPTENPSLIYSKLKTNSRLKKRVFDLDKDKFIEWYFSQKKSCYYCGVAQDLAKKVTKRWLEIERLNNDIGYVLNNMTLACSWCNKTKSNILSEAEMKKIAFIIKDKYKHLCL